jgi:hypothetical protein
MPAHIVTNKTNIVNALSIEVGLDDWFGEARESSSLPHRGLDFVLAGLRTHCNLRNAAHPDAAQ